ncbi:MAG: 50S ribosomal protein L15 [Planctomycetota bacterium]|jgi:large subunit ribosomal protein L15
MLNHEITSKVGKHKRRRRVGRGTGSGHGKTCGRGHKGAGSRAGSVSISLYEGGQMPLFRRLPKRGFSNVKFATRCEIVNICQLERFEDGSSVSVEQLSDAGLIDSNKSKVKILGKGDLTRKLEVTAHKFSKSAEEKITASGGTARVI